MEPAQTAGISSTAMTMASRAGGWSSYMAWPTARLLPEEGGCSAAAPAAQAARCVGSCAACDGAQQEAGALPVARTSTCGSSFWRPEQALQSHSAREASSCAVDLVLPWGASRAHQPPAISGRYVSSLTDFCWLTSLGLLVWLVDSMNDVCTE